MLPELQLLLADCPADAKPLVGDADLREILGRLMGRSRLLDQLLEQPDEVSADELTTILGAIESDLPARYSVLRPLR